jgi:hypothetical protein
MADSPAERRMSPALPSLASPVAKRRSPEFEDFWVGTFPVLIVAEPLDEEDDPRILPGAVEISIEPLESVGPPFPDTNRRLPP